jgi:hypothetical protein
MRHIIPAIAAFGVERVLYGTDGAGDPSTTSQRR